MPTRNLRCELLKETHDTKWAGHHGEERTLAFLARYFHWLKIKEDMQAYVKTCHVCQVDKTEGKKEAGLLQPLPFREDHCSVYRWTSSVGFRKLRAYDQFW